MSIHLHRIKLLKKLELGFEMFLVLELEFGVGVKLGFEFLLERLRFELLLERLSTSSRERGGEGAGVGVEFGLVDFVAALPSHPAWAQMTLTIPEVVLHLV